jgi:hypothetical protein
MRRISLLVGFTLCLVPAIARAQCDTASITSATWDAEHKDVAISLSLNALTSSNATWTLLDTTTAMTVPARVEYEWGHGHHPGTASSLVLIPSSPLETSHSFSVSVAGLRFEGCSSDSNISHSVDTGNSIGPVFSFGPSDDRDSSDLYLAGAVAGAVGKSPAYVADVKLQVSWYLTAFMKVQPGFDFTGSNDPDYDGDSVTFGGRLPVALPNLRLVVEPGFIFESDKTFSNINAVVPVLANYVPRAWKTPIGEWYFEPRAGVELGGNITTAIGASYPQSIARVVGGLHIFWTIWSRDQSHAARKIVYVTVSGVNRWLLHSEPRFDQDDSGLVYVDSSRTSRSDVQAAINFDVTDHFGIAVSYENGRLPPVYPPVRNKFMVSLVLKGTLSNKSQ